MAIRLPLTLLAAASAVLANSSPSAAGNDTGGDYGAPQGIQWGECGFNASVPIECGTLVVPLDYSEPESGNLDLSLSKISAVSEPFKGSILFNFGGPGMEAIQTLGALAPLLLNATGGQHDLIAFDPRGTGNTIPFDCFDIPEARQLAQFQYRLETLLADGTDVALGDLWAGAGAFANICRAARQDIGELVGTAFVARDMMQIVDALEEDGLLRFWGLSYGTALGATAAAMFPDRIDRLVLDGVVNFNRYNNGFTVDAEQQSGADGAWTAFLEECIESGERCGLSQVNGTAEELVDTLNRVAEGFRTNPIAIGDTVVDYSTIIGLYYLLLQTPGDLTNATVMLNNIVNRENLVETFEYFGGLSASAQTGNEALLGIKCSDTTARSSDLEGVTEEVEFVLEASRIFGPISPANGLICAQWPFEAKERYAGHFRIKTPNPVLFVGNTHDPLTAAATAYSMSELLEGSVVVEQKGFGHTSIAQTSACTAEILRAYFVDGVTPDGNTECEVDLPLFP